MSVLRAFLGYCLLIFIVRIAGKRPGRQTAPFEYLLIFFLGGVTLTSMVGDDRSLTNAVIQILTVAMTHVAMSAMKKRFPRFGLIFDGTPLVLYKHRQWQPEVMSRMRINEEDVMTSVRDRGLRSIEDIDYAVLERSGEVVVIPRSGQPGPKEE